MEVTRQRRKMRLPFPFPLTFLFARLSIGERQTLNCIFPQFRFCAGPRTVLAAISSCVVLRARQLSFAIVELCSMLGAVPASLIGLAEPQEALGS
eukprot:4742-Heterococcus_DN1.PRE.2